MLRNLLLVALLVGVAIVPSLGIPLSRRERFPSVEERIKLYASNWYHPPCTSAQQYRWRQSGHSLIISNFTFDVDVIPDQVFYLTEDIIRDCARDMVENETLPVLPTSSHIQFRQNMRMYCVDSMEMIELMDHHLNIRGNVPLLIHFGDSKTSHNYGLFELPHFKKFRSGAVSSNALDTAVASCKNKPLETVHSSDIRQPIVWKLATHRHYRQLPDVFRSDTAWDDKVNKAIFRGQLTGARDGYEKHEEDLANCQRMRRCRLVLDMHNNEYVDAKLTTTRARLPDVLNGVPLVGNTITVREMMRYKGIIMLEGNDVASGLKWALLSQSVVLMPTPRHTSWCMEELLEPWVHYIPLKDDASDAAEKMKWLLDNEEEARRIAQRGTLWMEDLIFHPDAAREDRLIKEELLRRYFAHFALDVSSKKH
jgi:Glycosyl transferase family 90